jgi:hypothetical protein
VCPKFKEDVCEIAGIRPDTIECLDGPCCCRKMYESCKLYIVEYMIGAGIATRGDELLH